MTLLFDEWRVPVPALLLPAYHKRIHLIVGFHHTIGYGGMHSPPSAGHYRAPRDRHPTETGRPAVGEVAHREHPPQIVAAGGDGTLRTAADYLVHTAGVLGLRSPPDGRAALCPRRKRRAEHQLREHGEHLQLVHLSIINAPGFSGILGIGRLCLPQSRRHRE